MHFPPVLDFFFIVLRCVSFPFGLNFGVFTKSLLFFLSVSLGCLGIRKPLTPNRFPLPCTGDKPTCVCVRVCVRMCPSRSTSPYTEVKCLLLYNQDGVQPSKSKAITAPLKACCGYRSTVGARCPTTGSTRLYFVD